MRPENRHTQTCCHRLCQASSIRRSVNDVVSDYDESDLSVQHFSWGTWKQSVSDDSVIIVTGSRHSECEASSDEVSIHSNVDDNNVSVDRDGNQPSTSKCGVGESEGYSIDESSDDESDSSDDDSGSEDSSDDDSSDSETSDSDSDSDSDDSDTDSEGDDDMEEEDLTCPASCMCQGGGQQQIPPIYRDPHNKVVKPLLTKLLQHLTMRPENRYNRTCCRWFCQASWIRRSTHEVVRNY